MVRLSFLGLVLAVAVLSPVVVQEGAIAGAMMGETQEQGVTQKKAEADRLLGQSKQLESISEYEAALKAGEQALAIYQEIGDRNGEASALNSIGIVYRSLSPYDKAIDYSQRALAIFREVNNRNGEAEALHNLAAIYGILENKSKSLEYIQQSVQIYREIANKKGEAEALVTLGISYARIPKQDEAVRNLKQALSLARSIGYQDTELRALLELGYRDINNAEYDNGINRFKQALTIARQFKYRELQAQALTGLGLVSLRTDKYKSAITVFEDALKITQQTKHSRGEAAITQLLGECKARLMDFESAIQDFESAKNIFHKIKLYHREASVWNDLGFLHRNSNDFVKAEQHYEKAVNIAHQYGFEENELKSLRNLIYLYGEQMSHKIFDIAERYTELARKINPEDEVEAMLLVAKVKTLVDFDMPNLVSASRKALQKIQQVDVKSKSDRQKTKIIWIHQEILRNLANGLIELGEYEDAMQSIQDRLSILRTSRDRKKNIPNEIDALIARSKIHAAKQEWSFAITALEEAKNLVKNVQEIRKDDKTIFSINIYDAFVNLYILKGDSIKALLEAQEAVKIAQQSNNTQLNIKALDIRNKVYRERNDLTSAFNGISEQVSLTQKSSNLSNRMMTLLALSEFYLDLGNYKKSREIVEKAKLEIKTDKIPVAEFFIQMLLAKQGLLDGDYQKALELEQLVSRQTSIPTMHGIAYWLISQSYAELGDDRKSLEAAQQSLALTQKTRNQSAERLVLILIGDIHRKFGRHQEAISSYNKALTSLDKRQNLSTNNQIVKIYAGLAKTHVALNQPTVAITFYKQAINNVEKSRTSLRDLSPNLQKSFLQSTIGFGKVKTADIYRDLADLLLSQGQILEAQQILELLQVEELKDATQPLRSNRKPQESPLNPLQQDLINRHGSLIAFGYDLEKCRTDKCDRLSTLVDQFTELQNQYNIFLRQFDSEIRRTRSDDEAAFDPKRLDSAQALIKATEAKTKEKTVLIYPLVLDQRLWLVWVSSSGVKKSEPVPVKQAALAKVVLEFRQLMGECEKRTCGTQDTAKLQAVSSKLYDWLIRPIEPELTKNQIQNLIFTLDRTVRYIPMSALYDNQQKQYLAQKYTVSTVLSAELTQAVDRAPFTRDQTQVLALGTSQGFRDFSPLAFVPIETGTIVRSKTSSPQALFPGVEWLNNKFTADTLRTELIKREYRIAHLATHGKFIPGSPHASFLLTGDGKEFTIDKIQNLISLDHLDLIVLSACESALGGDPNKLNGIEIASMSYEFLNRQAKSVLASLWKVSDPSTALFMQQFYTHLADGKTKAQAIQKVQQDFIDRKLTPKEADKLRGASMGTDPNAPIPPGIPRSTPADYTHPFYWAPFILIGNNL